MVDLAHVAVFASVFWHATHGVRTQKHHNTKTALAEFPENFWFGLATAAAHVEVTYPDDPWVAWAERGHVAAYRSPIAGPYPTQRLRFLEEPEVEIDLASRTGVKVFRLGVEWGRLVPHHPVGEPGGVTDRQALARYKEICEMIRAKGMKVMLTLFHHAIPTWSGAFGGWLEEPTVGHFLAFAKDVATELADVVDYWVTFNEPHVFILLSNCAGLWPPGPPTSVGEQLACLTGALPWVNTTDGGYTRAMHHIERSHIEFYKWAHSKESPLTNPSVGVAHNVAFNEAYQWSDVASTAITEALFKFGFIDNIKSHLDWLGLNYYGKELLGGAGPVILPSEEYSESGRTVYPDGLYHVLMQFHKRYLQNDNDDVKFKSIIITENGISDSTDILRPGYLVEHLLAIREAIRQGVPVEGYVHWTISDNWEWADGYCPKFGLVDVDRSTTEFKRTPRNSYNLFSDIVATNAVSHTQRNDAWNLVYKAVVNGKKRPFCRDMRDQKSGLDMPELRDVIAKDWRFKEFSAEENQQCHTTPWAPWEDDEGDFGVFASAEGKCNVLPKEWRAGCPRAVQLHRSIRCQDSEEKEETRSVICPGAPGVEEPDGCSTRKSIGLICCCDERGNCGSSLLSSMRFGNACPSGLKWEWDSECAKVMP